MRCISPLRIRVSGSLQDVPCGKCTFCLMSRRADWSFRIAQEAKHSSTAYFLTLTYGNFSLPIFHVGDYGVRKVYPYEFSLVKPDFQNFMKRFRQECFPVKVRYYAVGEYGEKNQRPHYHALMFNAPFEVIQRVEKIWGFGFCKVGDVNPASIHYVTKYVMKPKIDYGGREPPFALMSRKPGIGSAYLGTHWDWHHAGGDVTKFKNYTNVNGFKNKLPRFYRERFFSVTDREYMAVATLDICDQAYRDAVVSLSKYHHDADGYYYQRLYELYESLTNKLENGKNI